MSSLSAAGSAGSKHDNCDKDDNDQRGSVFIEMICSFQTITDLFRPVFAESVKIPDRAAVLPGEQAVYLYPLSFALRLSLTV